MLELLRYAMISWGLAVATRLLWMFVPSLDALRAVLELFVLFNKEVPHEDEVSDFQRDIADDLRSGRIDTKQALARMRRTVPVRNQDLLW